MKDIVISGKKAQRELWVFCGCLLAGMLTNVGAVIGYHRPWTELFSQSGYAVALGIGIYAVLALLRGLFFLLLVLIRKIR